MRRQVQLQLSYHLQLVRNERRRKARGMSERGTTHKKEDSGGVGRHGEVQAGEPLPERLLNRLSMWKKIGAKEVVEMGA
jgi:hypothetical protein